MNHLNFQKKTQAVSYVISVGNYFLNSTQFAQELRPRVDKWGFSIYKASVYLKKQSGEEEAIGLESLPAIHLTEDWCLEYIKSLKKKTHS